jgi:hypothetical protein
MEHRNLLSLLTAMLGLKFGDRLVGAINNGNLIVFRHLLLVKGALGNVQGVF